jgi:hypothetical protein
MGNSEATKSTQIDEQRLEQIWARLQQSYSINAQISKNMVNLFLASTRQNFADAHRAVQLDDPHYAADQIAEAAFRMRKLFKEIPADDISVSVAVKTAFTRHVSIDKAFRNLVLEKLTQLDPQWESGENRAFYDRALSNWLQPLP